MTDDRTVTVFTREDCHLCDDAIATIRRVSDDLDADVKLELVDVDEDEELKAKYSDRVPYVFVDGTPAFKYRVDPFELRQRLTE